MTKGGHSLTFRGARLRFVPFSGTLPGFSGLDQVLARDENPPLFVWFCFIGHPKSLSEKTFMELPQLPIFNATIDEDGDWSQGIYGVSFVENGAVLQDFLTMADQPKPILFKDTEKREIVGVLLIPEQLIYRNDGQKEYYIRWTADMIERAAVRMAATLAYQNFTLDHSWFLGLSGERSYEQSTVSGVECLRLWVTYGQWDDLYTKYGFDVRKCPVGTLAIHVKVNNEELWKQCKDGTFNSFSIEGVVSYEQKQE